VRPRFGYRGLCALLAPEGQKANHKCIYRLYRAESLVVRRRRRKRVGRWYGSFGGSAAANQSTAVNQKVGCASSGPRLSVLTFTCYNA
jgi:hypothetical protein